MTKQLQAHHGSDELRTLIEAEIDTVSGGTRYDFGVLGELEFHPGGCVTWAWYNDDGSWTAAGQC